MKIKIVSLVFGAISVLTMESAFAAWTWSPFMEIDENYFIPHAQGVTTRNDILLRMGPGFNMCNNDNGYAKINSELIGEEQFNVLTSVVLAAWMANKPIAILHEGCDGNTARVYGLRIGK